MRQTYVRLVTEHQQILASLQKLDAKCDRLTLAREQLEVRRARLEKLLGSKFPDKEHLSLKYKELSLSDAIVTVLKDNSNSLTPNEIYYLLTYYGFKTEYPNVFIMCKKLANSDRVKEAPKDGKRAFSKR